MRSRVPAGACGYKHPWVGDEAASLFILYKPASQPSQEICKQGTPQKNTFCYNAQQARLLWLVISSVQQRYNWLLQSKAMKRQQSSVADELESTELSMGDHHIFSSISCHWLRTYPFRKDDDMPQVHVFDELPSSFSICAPAWYPQRVCYHQGVCQPGVTHEGFWASSKRHFPKKNKCDKQVSSWRHISCHTDKNRYYTWS